ncbi:MAG TPA: hypothetical protein VGW10_00310 [Solirubrobacteraceae bacterium]|nr:hypothetical protein [Solirubrobacteraceae bacterium]
MAAAVGALAVPATAGADVNNGSDCTYAQSEEVTTGGAAPVVVYAGTGDAGMTGTALVAGGACANGLNAATPIGTLDGGAVEAGAGTPIGGPGAYAIVDGDNQNTDVQGQSDGYIGLSTYETGAKGSCSGGGGGSNSGGCLGADGVGQVPVPGVACGNTSGNTWVNTTRDGCSFP